MVPVGLLVPPGTGALAERVEDEGEYGVGKHDRQQQLGGVVLMMLPAKPVASALCRGRRASAHVHHLSAELYA